MNRAPKYSLNTARMVPLSPSQQAQSPGRNIGQAPDPFHRGLLALLGAVSQINSSAQIQKGLGSSEESILCFTPKPKEPEGNPSLLTPGKCS
jgi:hypothetical protein